MRTSRRHVVVVLIALLAAGGALALGVFFIPALRQLTWESESSAGAREQAAELAWRREFGEPAELLSAFPVTIDNEAAVRLMALAKAIDLDPRGTLAAATQTYVSAELDKVGGPVEAPPAIVTNYLDAHRRDLDAVVDLPRAGPIVWRGDVSRMIRDPAVADLNLFRGLHRLLMARALRDAYAADLGGADRTLLAGWALIASLRDRPELVSQLLTLGLMDAQCGALRRIAVAPAPWRQRLLEHDLRVSYQAAATIEALVMLRELPAGPAAMERAARADYLEAMVPFLVKQRDAPLDDQVRDETTPEASSRSLGAIAAEIPQPGLLRALATVSRVTLELELVDRILDLREQKARLGRWPAAGPQSAASRVRGAEWLTSTSDDGRVTISFKRTPAAAPVVRFDPGR